MSKSTYSKVYRYGCETQYFDYYPANKSTNLLAELDATSGKTLHNVRNKPLTSNNLLSPGGYWYTISSCKHTIHYCPQ